MRCWDACGVVSKAHAPYFQLLEKCLALYDHVMLPKPAFNIRSSEDSLVSRAGRCGKHTCPRWWKVSRRILRNGGESCGEERFTSVHPVACQFCKLWHGFNGNSSPKLRSAKRALSLSLSLSLTQKRGRKRFLFSRDSD